MDPKGAAGVITSEAVIRHADWSVLVPQKQVLPLKLEVDTKRYDYNIMEQYASSYCQQV